jgi:stalled ribosome rescue protein Dom34
MTTKDSIGVFIDHSTARLIELTKEGIIKSEIISEFDHQAKEESLNKSENLMHNKEQHQQAKYYNKIKNIIKDYKHIVLFGPTTAKNELMNLIKADHHFEKTIIDVKQTDKLTDNQQYAFVKDHFQSQ